jgi:hypothetical protein
MQYCKNCGINTQDLVSNKILYRPNMQLNVLSKNQNNKI